MGARQREGKVSAQKTIQAEKLAMRRSKEELTQEFVHEALAADAAIEKGAAIYRAEDVHLWLKRLAQNRRPARPKSWRNQPGQL